MGLNKVELERIFYQRLNFEYRGHTFLRMAEGILKAWVFFISLFYLKFQRKNKSQISGKLFVYTSKNQSDVLRPIELKLDNTSSLVFKNSFDLIRYVSISPFSFRFDKEKITWVLKNWVSVIDIFFVIYSEAIVKSLIKKLHCVDRLFLASDHGMIVSFFIVATRNLNIKRFYVQHGMVTSKFPKLEFNTYFSFGETSVNCYQNLNSTRVLNVGKRYANPPQGNKLKNNRIGISINELDSKSKLNYSIFYLKRLNPTVEIIVRPHPAMSYKSSNDILIHNGTLDDYFDQIDINLSCESTIHLDSIYYNTPTYYINLLRDLKFFDYYGFLKNELIEHFNYSLEGSSQINFTIAEKYIANIWTKEDPLDIILNNL